VLALAPPVVLLVGCLCSYSQSLWCGVVVRSVGLAHSRHGYCVELYSFYPLNEIRAVRVL
jgi:hypothetical protein